MLRRGRSHTCILNTIFTNNHKNSTWTCPPSLSLQAPPLIPRMSRFSAAAATDILEDKRPLHSIDKNILIARLEAALEEKQGEHAWKALQKLTRLGAEFPERILLKDFLTLMATKDDVLSLYRAYKVLSRLSRDNKLEYVNGELLGSLGLAFAKADMTDLSASTLRTMIHCRHFPPLDLWKSMMQFWVLKPSGAIFVIKVFLEICLHVTRGPSAKDVRISGTKPDFEAFNLALQACALLKQPEKAEEILGYMPRFEFRPDKQSFRSLITAHENICDIGQMKKILQRMSRAKVVPDSTILESMVSVFVNSGQTDAASHLLFSWCRKQTPVTEVLHSPSDEKRGPSRDRFIKEMLEVDKLIRGWGRALESPSDETITLVMDAFLKKGKIADAAVFLQRLCYVEGSDYMPCSFAFDGVIKLGLRDEVHSTLKMLAEQNRPADSASYKMLVTAYCKLPQPIKGEAVLKDAREVGHLLDVACYDSLIDAYNLLQEYDSACVAFKIMRQHRIVPVEPTFNRVFTYFEKHSKPKPMHKLVEVSLRHPPSQVDLNHWNRIVVAFGKGREMVDAKFVIKRMKIYGFHPETSTYTHLLNGYLQHGKKTNEILLLWEEVKKIISSSSNSAIHVKLDEVMANGFLSEFVKHGHFKKALEVIRHVEEQGLWVDKGKYRNIYRYLHKDLYGSKKKSREEVTAAEQKQIEAFRLWVGLGPPC